MKRFSTALLLLAAVGVALLAMLMIWLLQGEDEDAAPPAGVPAAARGLTDLIR
jgi:low affinity Fe/Cu permease